MQIRKIARDQTGSILISVILGLGLAALFRSTCRGSGCVIVRAPDLADVRQHTYRVSADACYRYTPEVVPCQRAAASASAMG